MAISIQPNPQSSSNASSYLVYVAMLQQDGTDAPTAIVLENTIGDIVWTRLDIGTYRGTLANAFPANRTWIIPSYTTLINGGDQIIVCDLIRISDNQIEMNLFDITDLSSADLMLADPLSLTVEIRIYPGS